MSDMNQKFTINHPSIVLLEKLFVPSPSGREGQIAGIVGEHLDKMGYLYEIDERGCFRFYLLGDRSGDIEVLKPHQVDANILFIIHDYIMNYKPNLQNKTTNLFENN